ncbi:hypothetical protein CYMTET_3824 [Cymbomonas tetramitiformis]|uniref:Uncharacterized protein n=1 Tax=Cymbomonas tetramitiformis TaxID=36881 RepID=A0AAE0LL43_9CHLO|nr:hypothetical protein CYMTET_3824 [Cymbomonas tetramitiformis]
MLVEGSAHAQANAILPQAPRRRAAEDVDERRAIRVKRTKSGNQGGAGVPKICRLLFEKTGKTSPPAAPVHVPFAAPTLAPTPLLQPPTNGAAFGATPRN